MYGLYLTENDDFISFAVFCNGGRLEFSTRLNFTILKPWNLIMHKWVNDCFKKIIKLMYGLF